MREANDSMTTHVDVAVVGAGVIGLAVAAEVARDDRIVVVLEKNDGYGLGTSSRNSQVIHAGIYYPADSLKGRTCVEGREMLYRLCSKHDLPHKRTGKIIVVTDQRRVAELEELHDRGRSNGVDDLELLSRQEVKRLEPNVTALAGLFSPSTGVVDVFALMRHFVAKVRCRGGKVVYRSKVQAVERRNGGFTVHLDDRDSFSFDTKVLVNCAGLASHELAEAAGLDIDDCGYRIHMCKGEYFRLSSQKGRLIGRPVYPLPGSSGAGLGIHATPTLDGRVLLGPSSRYVHDEDYSVDCGLGELFYQSVVEFLPFVEAEDLEPEMAGIRPTLQGPDDVFRDFVIRDEVERGLPSFVNLIGIESPGLTAAPAIASFVGAIVTRALRN